MRALPVFVAAVIAACGSMQVSGGAAVDPVLAALIPPDTVLLAGIRMEPLKSTPLYKQIVATRARADLDDFARRTSFDPRKDVRE
ncbi:MAG: hypothetical protein ACRD96_00960, partial [Bryobacteraceae bacterium]